MNREDIQEETWVYFSKLAALIFIAVILLARAVWLFLGDTEHFPINTVQIKANYRCMDHKKVQRILEPHLQYSFFTLSPKRLRQDLLKLSCVRQVHIEREWPDKLILQLEEQTPFVRWNNLFMAKDGEIFSGYESNETLALPQLNGPPGTESKVLAQYKNLSKILSDYGLSASIVTLRENGAWELILTNALLVRLGKNDIEERLTRFAKSYHALEAEQNTVPESVDLRYPRGMAVKWRA